ncbi:hypothetical protein QAD02_009086 [Eretmocerus hayati]|uniref:Uncharacterized protein n=1 Tax=Eretmocerus hayati TaxID=131215 RepID=A0ACC2N913_9HYME|nr:hypothetical protein QAD02_009086 [Eretmocerus hayati]
MIMALYSQYPGFYHYYKIYASDPEGTVSVLPQPEKVGDKYVFSQETQDYLKVIKARYSTKVNEGYAPQDFSTTIYLLSASLTKIVSGSYEQLINYVGSRISTFSSMIGTTKASMIITPKELNEVARFLNIYSRMRRFFFWIIYHGQSSSTELGQALILLKDTGMSNINSVKLFLENPKKRTLAHRYPPVIIEAANFCIENEAVKRDAGSHYNYWRIMFPNDARLVNDRFRNLFAAAASYCGKFEDEKFYQLRYKEPTDSRVIAYAQKADSREIDFYESTRKEEFVFSEAQKQVLKDILNLKVDLADFNLVNKSYYAASYNPQLHFLIHCVGTLLLSERSKNAHSFVDKNLTNISSNAKLMAYAFANTINLRQVFKKGSGGEVADAPENVVLDKWLNQQIEKIGEVRPNTIGEYVARAFKSEIRTLFYMMSKTPKQYTLVGTTKKGTFYCPKVTAPDQYPSQWFLDHKNELPTIELFTGDWDLETVAKYALNGLSGNFLTVQIATSMIVLFFEEYLTGTLDED